MSKQGIRQLRELVVNYCAYGGSSRGAREFLSQHVADFKTTHPGAVVRGQEKPGRHPHLDAVYASSAVKTVGVKNCSGDEVAAWAHRLASSAGFKRSAKVAKDTLSHRPSVQGVWTPFTFTPRPASLQGLKPSKSYR